MPSTNSSAGTAPNPVWRLTGPSFFATDFFLNLAPSTINVRRAAVRRLAYEASDTAAFAEGGGHGFIYRYSEFQDIDVPGSASSSPNGINGDGEVTGGADARGYLGTRCR